MILPNNNSELSTSAIEVSLISNKGFWLLVEDEELFVPYSEFPWFKHATIEQIVSIERPGKHHLYWPLLDTDLSLESLRDPDRFPLISKP